MGVSTFVKVIIFGLEITGLLDALRIDGASTELTVLIYAVGILAMVLSVIAYQFKYRVTIIVVNFSGQACWVIYFLLQSDFTSAVSCALTVIVMAIYSMKGKWTWVSSKICFATFMVAMISFSLVTFAGWKDIFPLLAGVFAVIANSRSDEHSLRFFSAIWCALWLMNSILKVYPVAFVNDVLCTSSSIISIFRYSETKPSTEETQTLEVDIS